MLIEIRLFGNLWGAVRDGQIMAGTATYLPANGGSTVGQILAGLGVAPEEVGNIFLNGRLLPRSAYPVALGYPLAADGPLSSEAYLHAPVRPGDRVGIFPRNMSLVVV